MAEEISDRARALLHYFWQIAADPRVRGGKTGDAIFAAVVTCAKEDWADVWAHVLRNGKRIAREQAPRVVGGIATELVDRALDWIAGGSTPPYRR